MVTIDKTQDWASERIGVSQAGVNTSGRTRSG
jgi:hypothetical protein